MFYVFAGVELLELLDVLQSGRLLDQFSEFVGGEFVGLELAEEGLVGPEGAVAGKKVGTYLGGGEEFAHSQVAEDVKDDSLVEGDPEWGADYMRLLCFCFGLQSHVKIDSWVLSFRCRLPSSLFFFLTSNCCRLLTPRYWSRVCDSSAILSIVDLY